GVVTRYDESHRAYEEARLIDEERTKKNPADRGAALDLSFDYSDLGWVLSRMNRDREALSFYMKALEIRKVAVVWDPNDARAAASVASSTGRIAGVYFRLGELDRALDWHKKAAVLWSHMAELRNGDWATVTELADAHWNLGECYEEMATKRHRADGW